ncbi:3-glucan synthase mok12 [Durusdinium trenchii]|uniref:3-glucan synthase mok12 n=1 Tax=Durusdinium trenchii TaxID=1381693 RepID=A0ABP0QKB8_9DINO
MKRPAALAMKRPAASAMKRPAALKRPSSTSAAVLKLSVQDSRGGGYPLVNMSMEIEKGQRIDDVRGIIAQAFGGPPEFMQFSSDGQNLSGEDSIDTLAKRGQVNLDLRQAPDAPLPGSQWMGENTMQVPADAEERKGTVWMESTGTGALSATEVSADDYAALLRTLQEDEDLMRLRNSPDNFRTEVNDVVAERAWCRVFRYEDCTIAPDPEQSIEYFDAFATAIHAAHASSPGDGGFKPLVSSLSCQASVNSAKGDAWLRVLGVVKYDNISFGILQEYDGEGFLIALRGGELKTRFLVEVLMGFSDALYRQSHSMWMGARYKFFSHRFQVWRSPTQGALGPKASSFHASLQEAFEMMGYAQVGTIVVQQLERVLDPAGTKTLALARWKSHAKGLGKKSFGIFGEFYVTPERYSTMTGRGKDHAMYGTDQFIEGPQTMKGGIVYSYYWYMFTAFIYGKPQYADGFGLAYAEEQNMLDTYDEVAGQKRYAMWNFCNNHDNWRMQSMTSTQHLFVCLVIITFWPGIPLHYAGDEQNFRTPGSALDGWAREELSPSLAWQAVRHQDNFLQRDSFDMTSRNYLFIARLNALRSLYFQNFGSSVCDDLKMPQEHLLDVVAFIRGCRQEDEVLVIANFHAKERRRAELFSHWAQGVVLQDSVERTNPWNLTVGAEGHVLMMVPPMNAFVFAPAPLRRDEDENAVRSGEEESASESAPPSALTEVPWWHCRCISIVPCGPTPPDAWRWMAKQARPDRVPRGDADLVNHALGVFEDLDLLLNFPDMDAADIGTSVPVESPHNDVPAGGRRE